MGRKLAASVLAMVLLATAGTVRAEGKLHLYNWGNYTSPELIAKFEQAHQVKVTVTEFASNAAALEKVKAGGHGFDLIVLSAEYMKIFTEHGLLRRIRPDGMANFANVAARWRDPPSDRGRRYSVPWQWGGIGMEVDSAVYDGDIDTSAIVFDPPSELEGKINVAPESDEIIAMALMYLGAKPCGQGEAVLNEVRDLLTAARPKWRSIAYGTADAAAYWSHGATRARQAKPSIRFAYPKEGFALWMDSVAALKGAANAENAKLFQNFIMAPENAALITAFAGHANGIDGSEAFLPDEMKNASEIVVPAEVVEAGVFLPACPADTEALYGAIWAELTE